jgi:hypothetical protein
MCKALNSRMTAPEDLHRWLRVWVVCWLEAQFLETESLEESVQCADEITEREATVTDKSLDLVELCEVSAVDGFIPEDTVNGKHLGRLEARLSKLEKHA